MALLVQGELLVLSKKKKKSTRIALLRTDSVESKPEIDAFRINDVAWSNDQIVCIGMFRDDPKQRRSYRFLFPFCSKLQVDGNGIPRNHQILWTTWHTEAKKLVPDGLIHSAGKPMVNSLISTEQAVVWRNEGHRYTEYDFPGTDHAYLEKSSWLLTDLTTGLTKRATAKIIEELGLLDLTKQRAKLISAELTKSLFTRGDSISRRRVEYLIGSFENESPGRVDPSSEQGDARQPATAPDSKSEDNEEPKQKSEGRSQ